MLPETDRKALWLGSCSALDGAPSGRSNEMSKTGQNVLREALQVELSERAELAAELPASPDGQPDEDVEATWVAEIERRAARARSGDNSGKPCADACNAAKDALGER